MESRLIGYKTIKSNKNNRTYVILNVAYNEPYTSGFEVRQFIMDINSIDNVNNLVIDGMYDIDCDFNGRVVSFTYNNKLKGEK